MWKGLARGIFIGIILYDEAPRAIHRGIESSMLLKGIDEEKKGGNGDFASRGSDCICDSQCKMRNGPENVTVQLFIVFRKRNFDTDHKKSHTTTRPSENRGQTIRNYICATTRPQPQGTTYDHQTIGKGEKRPRIRPISNQPDRSKTTQTKYSPLPDLNNHIRPPDHRKGREKIPYQTRSNHQTEVRPHLKPSTLPYQTTRTHIRPPDHRKGREKTHSLDQTNLNHQTEVRPHLKPSTLPYQTTRNHIRPPDHRKGREKTPYQTNRNHQTEVRPHLKPSTLPYQTTRNHIRPPDHRKRREKTPYQTRSNHQTEVRPHKQSTLPYQTTLTHLRPPDHRKRREKTHSLDQTNLNHKTKVRPHLKANHKDPTHDHQTSKKEKIDPVSDQKQPPYRNRSETTRTKYSPLPDHKEPPTTTRPSNGREKTPYQTRSKPPDRSETTLETKPQGPPTTTRPSKWERKDPVSDQEATTRRSETILETSTLPYQTKRTHIRPPDHRKGREKTHSLDQTNLNHQTEVRPYKVLSLTRPQGPTHDQQTIEKDHKETYDHQTIEKGEKRPFSRSDQSQPPDRSETAQTKSTIPYQTTLTHLTTPDHRKRREKTHSLDQNRSNHQTEVRPHKSNHKDPHTTTRPSEKGEKKNLYQRPFHRIFTTSKQQPSETTQTKYSPLTRPQGTTTTRPSKKGEERPRIRQSQPPDRSKTTQTKYSPYQTLKTTTTTRPSKKERKDPLDHQTNLNHQTEVRPHKTKYSPLPDHKDHIRPPDHRKRREKTPYQTNLNHQTEVTPHLKQSTLPYQTILTHLRPPDHRKGREKDPISDQSQPPDRSKTTQTKYSPLPDHRPTYDHQTIEKERKDPYQTNLNHQTVKTVLSLTRPQKPTYDHQTIEKERKTHSLDQPNRDSAYTSFTDSFDRSAQDFRLSQASYKVVSYRYNLVGGSSWGSEQVAVEPELAFEGCAGNRCKRDTCAKIAVCLADSIPQLETVLRYKPTVITQQIETAIFITNNLVVFEHSFNNPGLTWKRHTGLHSRTSIITTDPCYKSMISIYIAVIKNA
nr:serine/arginine repetitive matrix protein 1-like [Penaeus vannamei]